MAHIIQRTMILDSSRESVWCYYFQSDGTSGELSKAVLLDPTVDSVPFTGQGGQSKPGQVPYYTVLELWFNFNQFSGILQYDGLSPQNIWLLSQSSGDSHFDFNDNLGGIKDRTGPYGNGRVTLTTQGFAGGNPVGDQTTFVPSGSLLIRYKKNNNNSYVLGNQTAPMDRPSNTVNPTGTSNTNTPAPFMIP